jgi:hypothetical protein
VASRRSKLGKGAFVSWLIHNCYQRTAFLT